MSQDYISDEEIKEHEYNELKETVSHLETEVERLEEELSKVTTVIDEFLFHLKEDTLMPSGIREHAENAYKNFFPGKK